MFELNEDECDAIGEIFNIAIGQAAAALSDMVDEPVNLAVPSVRSLSREEARTLIENHIEGSGCAVQESFDGQFSGMMLLIFPKGQGLELVRRLINELGPVENVTELEQDALMEIGNIILTSCLSSLADTLGLAILETGLPEIVHGSGIEILDNDNVDVGADDLVLFADVDFVLNNSRISGYLLMALGVNSAQSLRDLIRAHLKALGMID